MTKLSRFSGLLGFAVLMSVSLAPRSAEAKVPFFYTGGETAFAIGPLPPPYDADSELAGFQAGYLCKVHGVFYSYFSISECRAVAFKGETYSDEPGLVRALSTKYSEKDMQLGTWTRYGWMPVLGLIALSILFWLKKKLSDR